MSSSPSPRHLDLELSSGVVAYLSYSPAAPDPGLRRPANVAAVAVDRSPDALLAEVRALLSESDRIPVHAARGDFAQECVIVGEQIVARHPELTGEAQRVLINAWALGHR